MNFPCINKLNCECESPLNNLTAEEPDRIKFYSERDSGAGPSDGWYLGYSWLCDHCHVLCESEISQLDSDDCAERNARLCAWLCIDPTPPPRFRSAEQTCSIYCDEDGQWKTATVIAGYALGNSQEEADAKAYADACELAALLCYSVPAGMYAATPQTCTFVCADGTSKTYTTDENKDGKFLRTTQAQADAAAYEFACLMASYLCPPSSPYYSSSQTCVYTCPDGTSRTKTVPANLFPGTTQAEADAAAYAYACWLASMLCSTPPTPEPPDPPVATYYNVAMLIQVPCPAGGIFNYPMAAGVVVSNQNQLDADTRAYSLGVERATADKVCPDKDHVALCLDSVPTFDTLTLYGGHPPFTWSIVGLPAGIQAIQQDAPGRIFVFAPSYLPLSAGVYLAYLHIVDSLGNWLDLPLAIYVAQILDVSLPAGQICVDYSHQLTAAGPSGTKTWRLYSGYFPPGLMWSDTPGHNGYDPSYTGIITGKPTSQHTHPFRVIMEIA